MTKQYQAVILRIERALPVSGWPLASYKEVTACLEAGRLLLFVYLNKQAANAGDDQGVSEKLTICNHWAAPFPSLRGQEAAPQKRGVRLPLLAALNEPYHTSAASVGLIFSKIRPISLQIQAKSLPALAIRRQSVYTEPSIISTQQKGSPLARTERGP